MSNEHQGRDDVSIQDDANTGLSVQADFRREIPPHHRGAAESVEQMIEQVGPQPGSAIAAWLRSDAGPKQGFDPKAEGYENLSQFLTQCAPRLRRISKVGADVVWGLEEHAPPLVDVEPLAHKIWRAIASPNSERSVIVSVNPSDKTWRIQSASEAAASERDGVTDGEWKRIPPLSTEGHRVAAQSFLSRPEVQSLRSALERGLEDKLWWKTWTSILDGHPGLASAWYATREAALRNHIRNALSAAGVEGAELAAAVAYPTPAPPSGTQSGTRRDPVKFGAGRTSLSIRDLVLMTIDQMDEGQLRELRLPAGSVLDALRRG